MSALDFAAILGMDAEGLSSCESCTACWEPQTSARRARETCTGCGSPRLSAILAVIGGAAACCPECSTLTVEERNAIRARLADELEKPKTCETCKHCFRAGKIAICTNDATPVFEKFDPVKFGCILHSPREASA